jgi:hypothetical protein
MRPSRFRLALGLPIIKICLRLGNGPVALQASGRCRLSGVTRARYPFRIDPIALTLSHPPVLQLPEVLCRCLHKGASEQPWISAASTRKVWVMSRAFEHPTHHEDLVFV